MRHAWLLAVVGALAAACHSRVVTRETPVRTAVEVAVASPPSDAVARPANPARDQRDAAGGAPSLSVSAEELAALRHRPLLVLYEFAEARGDAPAVVVLYEDGLVLFERVVGSRLSRFSVRWAPDRVAALADEWMGPLVVAPPGFDVRRERHHGSVEILFRRGTTWSVRRAYGFDRKGREIRPNAPAHPLTPEEQGFRDVYATMIAFDPQEAQPWVAEDVELTLWGGDEEPGGVLWPKHLPPLPSAETLAKPRVHGQRHVVAGRHERAILQFLGQFQGAPHVRHEGRRFAIRYRPHAPDELHVLAVRDALRMQSEQPLGESSALEEN